MKIPVTYETMGNFLAVKLGVKLMMPFFVKQISAILTEATFFGITGGAVDVVTNFCSKLATAYFNSTRETRLKIERYLLKTGI